MNLHIMQWFDFNVLIFMGKYPELSIKLAEKRAAEANELIVFAK
jgi:hypothetical protein